MALRHLESPSAKYEGKTPWEEFLSALTRGKEKENYNAL